MSLWNDIQPWIDKETGLMTAADGGRDNLILMSAYLSRELIRLGEESAALTLHCSALKFQTATQVRPGLYQKLPGSTDNNTEDNMVGNCYFDLNVSDAIRARWNWHLSCFDVNNPNKFAVNQNLFARFFGLKAYIVACSGKKPWLVQRLIWCASTWFSVKYSTGASDPLKLMLQCDELKDMCPRTVAYWRRHYTAKSLYSQYFGPNHPLTKYSV